MPSASEIVAWRERLMDALFSGVLEARDSNGEMIRYRSAAELSAALNELDRIMRRMDGSRLSASITFNTSKGL